MSDNGFISLASQGKYFTLFFSRNGDLAAHLVQYLDDVIDAVDRPAAILKLLGFTMQIGERPPARKAQNWVIVDLDRRILQSNSRLIREAVEEQEPSPGTPPDQDRTLSRIHDLLDSRDFTVELFR